MSVGLLAHLYGQRPATDLAARIGKKGFTQIQLALWKALDDADFSEPGKLSPALAMDIGKSFEKQGISIAVLASYLHLHETDEASRSKTIARYKECIRYARFFGAPMVGTETGPAEEGGSEAEWNRLVQNVQELVKEAEQWGVFLALEAANGHLLHTAKQLRWLLDQVDSSNIGVILDPGNLMTEVNFKQQDDIIEEAFDLLGDRILAAHAKDRRFGEDGTLEVVPAGQGTMNYELYMKRLRAYKPGVPIILEECSPEEMRASKRYVESFLHN
ncbi:sugar phosphate isomerase/epimerase [Paenalkalicoccus suaedae]|uniref:Sugar phosphate isomerase/epimerase n=1 Tax=Paenalkalicoccus suaedae TaxID=2592382 RepID=A0A859F9F0_9BACI|nr:sugar phosphate isomerase/epimerase family protein [Paenalkalicoccus suaedae]QKS69743.1 sugar phosphate isomerase/epimerase [Paenalkalicoccus suaedae]